MRMRVFATALAATLATALATALATPAAAFECPKHFGEAQAAIDKTAADLEAAGLPAEQKALVHALLDDARMWLEGGRHNHEKPQGAFDHARAIAKADAALGHARAAAMLLARLSGG